MTFRSRLTNVRPVLIFVFLLISVRGVAAEEITSRPDEAVKPSPSVPGDAYRDLFPGPSGAGGKEPAQQATVNQAPMPIYESWDVLRQYPRNTPVPKSTTLDEKQTDK